MDHKSITSLYLTTELKDAIKKYVIASPILDTQSQLVELAVRDFLGMECDIKRIVTDQRTLKARLAEYEKTLPKDEKKEHFFKTFIKTAKQKHGDDLAKYIASMSEWSEQMIGKHLMVTELEEALKND